MLLYAWTKYIIKFSNAVLTVLSSCTRPGLLLTTISAIVFTDQTSLPAVIVIKRLAVATTFKLAMPSVLFGRAVVSVCESSSVVLFANVLRVYRHQTLVIPSCSVYANGAYVSIELLFAGKQAVYDNINTYICMNV